MTAFIKYFTSLLIVTIFTSSPLLADENWEGFYTGIAIGASLGTTSPSTEAIYNTGDYFTDINNESDREQLDPIFQKDIEGNDISASLLLGYHFQSGKLVYGLEADFTFTDYAESESEGPTIYDTTANSTQEATFTTTTSVESDYMVSLRPKIGYATEKFLVHFSAGPVISEFKTTFAYSDTFGGGHRLNVKDTETSIGLSVNVGIDYLLSDNLSLRADYTYYNFPDILNGSSDVNGDDYDDINYGSDFIAHNIRLALTKHF